MIEHPGTALAEPGWLAERIDDLAHAWSLPDRRVAGTLWWYMAADTLLADVVGALAHDRAVPDPALESVSVTLRPDGGVAAVQHRARTEPEAAIARLGEAIETVLDALAEVSGAGRASLAAITTDAVANRALAAAGPARAETLATDLAARLVVPAPRFVDVGPRRFVRRASCCLIYRAPRAEMCVSCPKRDPDERAALLTRMATD